MAAVINTQDTLELRRLIPLNTLPSTRFEQLCAECKVRDADRGTVLFLPGDTENELVYLLSGTVSLQAGGMELDAVTGGSDTARFALAQQIPRKVAAVAKDRIRYVRISPDWIREEPQPVREPARFTLPEDEAEDDDSECDWMSHILRSPVFQRVPPQNLQALIRVVNEVRVQPGAVICRQDDPGDYYYIIKKGRCLLTRQPSRQAKEIRLAVLKSCDTFGEDALISERPRTVTVTMLTEGKLLRIKKDDFLHLVRDPVIVQISGEAAAKAVQGGARWLDVRLPDAYDLGHARDSINAPFFSLRVRVATLDRQIPYVIVCEDSKLSQAAAFLLLRHGFQAWVLQNGIESLPRDEWVIDTEPMHEEALNVEIELAMAATSGAATAPEPPAPEPDLLDYDIDFDADPAEFGFAAPEAPEPIAFANPAPVPDPASAVALAEPPAVETSEALAAAQRTIGELRVRVAQLELEQRRAETAGKASRETADRLDAALQSLQEEHERLLTGGVGAKDLRAVPGGDADLRDALARVTQERRAALAEAADLRQQIAELQAVIEEISDGDGGEAPLGAETLALRAELKMVQEHAEKELLELRRLLNQSESDKSRFQFELQSLRSQTAVRLAAASASDDAASPVRKPAPGRHSLGAFALGLSLSIIVLTGLLATKPGRVLLRRAVPPATVTVPDRAESQPAAEPSALVPEVKHVQITPPTVTAPMPDAAAVPPVEDEAVAPAPSGDAPPDPAKSE